MGSMQSEYLKDLLSKIDREIPLTDLEIRYVISNMRLTEKGRQTLAQLERPQG